MIVVAWRRRKRMPARVPATVALLLIAILLHAPVAAWGQPSPVPSRSDGLDPLRPETANPKMQTATKLEEERQPTGTSSPMIADPDRYPTTPAATASQPWRLVQEIRFDATWLPGGGTRCLGINDVELAATLNVPLVEDWAPLLITPYAAAHYWMRPSGAAALAAPGLPSNLYDMNVEFAWRPRLAQWLFADLAITPGLYTDFKDVQSDSLMMRGRALAIVAFSKEFQLVAGGMYVNRNKTKFLPAGGLIWNPSEDTRCFLVFPQPKVSHRFVTVGDTQFWGYLAGEFGGGRWEIERVNGVADSVDYTDLRVLLGIESVHGQRLKGHFELGYVFARRVNFISDTPDYKPQDTVMLRAGVRY